MGRRTFQPSGARTKTVHRPVRPYQGLSDESKKRWGSNPRMRRGFAGLQFEPGRVEPAKVHPRNSKMMHKGDNLHIYGNPLGGPTVADKAAIRKIRRSRSKI
jgi:hypothetical protein